MGSTRPRELKWGPHDNMGPFYVVVYNIGCSLEDIGLHRADKEALESSK